jgi:hypothetical protein
MKLAKYKIYDIIQHNEDTNLTRKIIFIFDSFYDETGYSEEIYYQTIVIENNIPPTPLKESSIDKYYTIKKEDEKVTP